MRELVRRFAEVVAVEPDDAMRARIDAGTPLSGTAEAIPLERARVDAVFVCEAFHWFDTRRAIEEISRVLVPGGGLAIVSTHWWDTEPPLPQEAIDILREPFERAGGPVDTDWDAFEESQFEPLRQESFAEERVVDGETLLAMFSTISTFASLDAEERATRLGALRTLLDGPYRLPVKHTLRWTRLQVG